MMFQLETTDFESPRWAQLTPSDASALVGFAFAERKHTHAAPIDISAPASERLIHALFCAGAPWNDVIAAACDFASLVSRQTDMSSHAASRIATATRALFLSDAPREELKQKLQESALTLLKELEPNTPFEAELASDLRLYVIALGGSTPSATPATGGFGQAFFANDAQTFRELAEQCIAGTTKRAANSISAPPSSRFLSRVVGFTDFGRAALYAAMIPIANAAGLSIDELGGDLELFSSPSRRPSVGS